MIFESLFILIYLVAAGVLLWSRGTLNGFLAENRSIGEGATMERFKALARTQMYLALVMAGLLTSGMVVGLVLVVRYGLVGLLAVVLTNLVIIGLAHVHALATRGGWTGCGEWVPVPYVEVDLSESVSRREPSSRT